MASPGMREMQGRRLGRQVATSCKKVSIISYYHEEGLWTNVLHDPPRPVPTEVSMLNHLLKKQAEDSACTHNAICETHHHDVTAEHQADNLIASENAAIRSPIIGRYPNQQQEYPHPFRIVSWWKGVEYSRPLRTYQNNEKNPWKGLDALSLFCLSKAVN